MISQSALPSCVLFVPQYGEFSIGTFDVVKISSSISDILVASVCLAHSIYNLTFIVVLCLPFRG